MGRHYQIARDAVFALGRFIRAYRGMCLIAAAIYAASAALSASVLSLLPPPGNIGSLIAAWLASLPQIVLLAPVWTALLRFVILRDTRRRYRNWDHRVRRVLRVTVILSAVLMAGGVLFALSLDVMPHYPMRRLFIIAVLATTLLAKFVSWWLVMRLAIAPALAAAGTRRYALDTAFSFTRRWLGTIFGVKIFIYTPLFLLVGALWLAARLRPDLATIIISHPVSIAGVTTATALAELVDAAAMALVAVRIVRARKGEEDDGNMS